MPDLSPEYLKKQAQNLYNFLSRREYLRMTFQDEIKSIHKDHNQYSGIIRKLATCNVVDNLKTTILMLAILDKVSIEIIQDLLAEGADPFAQDSAGNSVLMFAAKSANPDIISAITDYVIHDKGDMDKLLNTKNQDHQTALTITVTYADNSSHKALIIAALKSLIFAQLFDFFVVMESLPFHTQSSFVQTIHDMLTDIIVPASPPHISTVHLAYQILYHSTARNLNSIEQLLCQHNINSKHIYSHVRTLIPSILQKKDFALARKIEADASDWILTADKPCSALSKFLRHEEKYNGYSPHLFNGESSLLDKINTHEENNVIYSMINWKEKISDLNKLEKESNCSSKICYENLLITTSTKVNKIIVYHFNDKNTVVFQLKNRLFASYFNPLHYKIETNALCKKFNTVTCTASNNISEFFEFWEQAYIIAPELKELSDLLRSRLELQQVQPIDVASISLARI